MNYFEERAADYYQRSLQGLWGKIKKQEINVVTQLLKPVPGNFLIDVGCGPGVYTGHFLKNYNMQITALDPSHAMIKELQARFPEVKTHHGTLESFCGSGKFNHLIALGIVEFISNPENFFQLASAQLKSGGNMVLLFPRDGITGVIYRWVHELKKCPAHIRSGDEYVKLAGKNGLKLQEKRSTAIASCYSFIKH